MTKTNFKLRAALAYQSHGFYVLPIAPNAKNPAIKFKDLPALSAEQVKNIWTLHPDYNIALRTVRHFVIDVDVPDHAGGTGATKDNGYQSLRTIPKELLPKTLAERTPSGGLHLYYTKPSNCRLNHQYLAWLPGIDIKAHVNNYALISPSTKGNTKYKWLNHLPMVEAPQALISYILTHGTNADRIKQKPLLKTNYSGFHANTWTGQLIDDIAASYKHGGTSKRSGRNSAIASLTGKMLRAGADPEAILVILHDVNSRFYNILPNGEKVADPLSESELEKTFASILKDEVKNHG